MLEISKEVAFAVYLGYTYSVFLISDNSMAIEEISKYSLESLGILTQ